MEPEKEVLVVRELEQIKALSNSYRISIIEAFDHKPATAKQISVRLNEPHGKINYHMKTLAKVGILELVEVSTKLGVVEKFYRPVAKNFVIDSTALRNEGAEFQSSLAKYSEALFERISKDFNKNFENKNITHTRKINYIGDVYLTQDEAKTLSHAIGDLVEAFIENKKEKRSETERYSVTSLVIPIDHK